MQPVWPVASGQWPAASPYHASCIMYHASEERNDVDYDHSGRLQRGVSFAVARDSAACRLLRDVPTAHPLFKTRGLSLSLQTIRSSSYLYAAHRLTITSSTSSHFLNSPTTAIPHTTTSYIPKNNIVGTQIPQLPLSAPGRGRTRHDLRPNVAFCTLRRDRSLSLPSSLTTFLTFYL